MLTFSIALQNLILNRRRAAVTIAAVVVGFVALCLVRGVVVNTGKNFEYQAIRAERLGHLTVARSGYFSEGVLDPARFVFSAEEVVALTDAIQQDPSVVLVTPRLKLLGVISNGEASTIFLAESLVAEHEAAFEDVADPLLRAHLPEGAGGGVLDPARPTGVAMGAGLARLLGLERGSTAVVLTSTVEGMANALDVTVVDVFNTGNPATDDKFLLAPLALGQELFDTQGAERLVVLLDDTANTAAAKGRLEASLAEAGFAVEVQSWSELSLFYNKVIRMFGAIFRVVSTIVLVVVLLTMLNTMVAMIAERTREIGTLRSLGMRRSGVARLFAAEGALIAVAGCLLGVPVAWVVAAAVNNAGITFVPPIASTPVPVLVRLDAAHMGLLLMAFTGVGVVASLVPALRAARKPIVDILGHH